MPGEVGIGIGQSAAVAGELIAVLLGEGLVLDGDELLVVPVQNQDVQVALLSVDDVLPLLADLGGAPIRGKQPWRSRGLSVWAVLGACHVPRCCADIMQRGIEGWSWGTLSSLPSGSPSEILQVMVSPWSYGWRSLCPPWPPRPLPA